MLVGAQRSLSSNSARQPQKMSPLLTSQSPLLFQDIVSKSRSTFAIDCLKMAEAYVRKERNVIKSNKEHAI